MNVKETEHTRCWECGSPLDSIEQQRGQCLNCFGAQDGPYEDAFKDDEK